MKTIKITNAIDNDVICDGLEFWGATDALVAYFGDMQSNEVTKACIACGDAIADGKDTTPYEEFLAIKIEHDAES